MDKFFPYTVVVLCWLGSATYLYHHNWKQSIIWFCYGLINSIVPNL